MLKFFNKSDIHSCVNQKRIDYYNHVYFRRIKTTKNACQCSVSLTQYREQYVNSLGLLILIPSQSMIVLTL